MIIVIGIAVYVGGLLTATTWGAIRDSDRIRRRRGSDRPYAL